MEKHHKLRRPAGSSIHGCNICGIEGHQAAHCPNGSNTNWAEKFGPEWTVDLDALRHKEPDYDALAARARAYAESRAKGQAGTSGGGESAKNESAGAPAAGGGGAPAGPPSSAWRVYYDPMGRPYYHNPATGQTSWTPPTA